MKIDNYNYMKDMVTGAYPNEACGILVDGEYINIENVSENPEFSFVMPDDTFIKYNPEAIIHSHIVDHALIDENGKAMDSRSPSKLDMECQIATGLPWGIVSTDGDYMNPVLWFGKDIPDDLYGRTFIHNVYDCFTLIRDWYRLNSDVRIASYPRDINWMSTDKNIYENNYKAEGFERVAGDIQYGDLLFFGIRSNYVNHAGIYLGGDDMLHHLINRLSGKDSVCKWNRQFKYAVRHKNFNGD